MTNIVVDTNVWATAGKSIAEVETLEEVDCLESCTDWLQEFLRGNSMVVVDSSSKVIDEYMTYILPGRFPESKLNQLFSELWGRMVYVDIGFDDNGEVILPLGVEFHDPADRKFVALAMSLVPYAPIYNATGTDWAKDKIQLSEQGIVIHELCPEYIQSRIGVS